jgi:hypothetical protein
MKYSIFNPDTNLIESITITLKAMCKENKINYEKQGYKILFSNEILFAKNNGVRFTSGSKKYLCFYGRSYSDKKGNISETIYLKDAPVTFNPENDRALLISGGIDNSTIVDNDENLLHFYIAPSSLLGLQDPDLWQNL